MRYRMIVAGILAMALYGGQAVAAEVKVAYVDVKSAIENTKAYRDGLQRLEAMKNQKQRDLDALKNKIMKAQKELQNQSLAISPDMASRKRQDINDLRKSLQRQQQDAQEALNIERSRLGQGILKKFNDAVHAYGKSEHYDMILTASAVIYGADAHDITSKITQILDKGNTK